MARKSSICRSFDLTILVLGIYSKEIIYEDVPQSVADVINLETT